MISMKYKWPAPDVTLEELVSHPDTGDTYTKPGFVLGETSRDVAKL